MATCSACGGTGVMDNGNGTFRTCRTCGGTGTS